MISKWWLWWTLFIFLFLVTPILYGWGYRGWGPPLPTYVQRRRGPRVSGSADLGHLAWGRRGDLVWMVVVIATMWAMTALLLWRR